MASFVAVIHLIFLFMQGPQRQPTISRLWKLHPSPFLLSAKSAAGSTARFGRLNNSASKQILRRWQVFEAWWQPPGETGKLVAVKTCKLGCSDKDRESFLAEARTLRQFSHPVILLSAIFYYLFFLSLNIFFFARIRTCTERAQAHWRCHHG